MARKTARQLLAATDDSATTSAPLPFQRADAGMCVAHECDRSGPSLRWWGLERSLRKDNASRVDFYAKVF
jgi:hypothetical protein